MSAQIMTLGQETRRFVLRGQEPLKTDFREIAFDCRFVEGATNGSPKIEVSVAQIGKGLPDTIRVELIPPGSPGFILSGTPAGQPAHLAPSWIPPRLVATSGAPGVPSVLYLLNTGSGPFDVGFGTESDVLVTDPLPPIPPLPDGGAGPSSAIFTKPLVAGDDPQGRWRMRLHNTGSDPAEFEVDVRYPETVQTLETTRVPFQLLNRAFSELLLLMRLSVRVDRGRAYIDFDPEFNKLTGLEDQLVRFDLSRWIDFRDINLESFRVCALKDAEFGWPVIRIGLELEERGREIAIPIFGPAIDIDDLSIRVDFSLHLASPPITDFFRTAMVRHNGRTVPRSLGVRVDVFTNPLIRQRWARFLVRLFTLNASSAAAMFEDFRSKFQGSLNELVRNEIRAYIQDVLVHLVRQDHVVQTVTADDQGIVVQHHAPPHGGRTVSPPGPVLDVGRAVVSPSTLAGTAVDTNPTDPGSTPTAPVPAAAGPTLRNPAAAAVAPARIAYRRLREGEIDHIVVLMLENRSFDHMLGYLSLKGKQVRGLVGDEQNALTDGNPPYVVHRLKQTRGIPSPGHAFEDTLEQIANGVMSGFVSSYAKRGGVTDPSLVMGYYTEAELPMYEFLANNFAVCDAWYSSHPGATWPNRFCATAGTAPERDNFDVADDRIGYFKGKSIFDLLTTFGADWAYVEGNVGFIRMYDRYRLDIQRVIPYRDDFGHDIDDTFVNRVRRGRLPAVTYIDPRYIDVPPSWDANDDLPPADVCHGQALVKEVYELLTGARETWPRTLLIITYDEHGGFFDHVAPPGNPGATDPSPLPRITPAGADHLGVRVPAILVSPWVDAAVITTRFEHTSIIRTILERFVSTDHAADEVLGARVAQSNSLFPLLRSQPRTDVPSAPAVVCTPGLPTRGPASRDDFHAAMRLLGVPAARRGNLFA